MVFAGLFLSVGGFLSFMLTESISAIRFGVILGGALLALSIASLRSWNRGEASASLLKGQAGKWSFKFQFTSGFVEALMPTIFP